MMTTATESKKPVSKSAKAKAAAKPVTLDQLRKQRTVLAPGPSGNNYRLRPLNLERYALTGGIPAPLRQIAREGQSGVEAIFGESGENADVFTEHGETVRDYLDDLVRMIVVDPDLKDADLDELPPIDYRWLVSVGMSETDEDGLGRKLWGQDPLSRWETFRLHHGCADECESCARVIEDFRAWTAES